MNGCHRGTEGTVRLRRNQKRMPQRHRDTENARRNPLSPTRGEGRVRGRCGEQRATGRTETMRRSEELAGPSVAFLPALPAKEQPWTINGCHGGTESTEERRRQTPGNPDPLAPWLRASVAALDWPCCYEGGSCSASSRSKRRSISVAIWPCSASGKAPETFANCSLARSAKRRRLKASPALP